MEEVESTVAEAGLKKPTFTKQPTTVLTVKTQDTATLIANIDGVPRPKGQSSLPYSAVHRLIGDSLYICACV